MVEYYRKNREKILMDKKREYEEKKESILLRKKKLYKKNKEAILEQKKRYYSENREVVLEKSKERYIRDKEKITRRVSEYYSKNKSSVISRGIVYARDRRASDPYFRMTYNLRRRLLYAIKGKTKRGSAIADLGCTAEFLIKYLEDKFSDGMSWGNYNYRGWHIDHIIPISHFDLSDRDQFLRANHYTNLQPMWMEENLKKGGRVKLE